MGSKFVIEKAYILKYLAILIIGIFIGVLFKYYFDTAYNSFLAVTAERIELPYKKDISKIFKNIEYTYVPAFQQDNVALTIDFSKKNWALSGIRKFNAQGEILLPNNRTGTCLELSLFIYQELSKIVDPRYNLKLARVFESNFAFSSNANHYVAIISEPALFGIREFIIDPSYRKYDSSYNLPEYYVYDYIEKDAIARLKKPDIVLPIYRNVFITLIDSNLVSLTLTDINNQFDIDNYLAVITARRLHCFTGIAVFHYGRENGKRITWEPKRILYVLRHSNKFRRLKEITVKLVNQFEKSYLLSNKGKINKTIHQEEKFKK